MNRRQTLTGLSATSLLAMTPVAIAASPKPRPVRVPTTAGVIEGQTHQGISRFLGIRYGMADRFAAPVPVPVSKDVIRADRYGPACFQRSTPDAWGKSEDCLFLNIWTPEASPKRKRPVMFYIHGGAYNNGSGGDPLTEGTNLAAHGDVVVVSVNHRLNVFGYLYLARLEKFLKGGVAEQFATSGNNGQLDLILALQWVKANIAQFGGDPDCVMVFGQSGGGAKIATLMATPAAKGLFHRAASMSGQQVTASGPGNATVRATAFLKALGLKPDLAGLEAVRTLPAETLVEALNATDPVLGKGSLYMGPVLDETVLMRHPFYPDAAPQSNAIPMIIGNTRDETRAFLGGNEKNHNLTFEELPAALAPQIPVDIDPFVVVDTYRRLYPDLSASDVFFAATTAGRSWRAAVVEAEQRARANAPTYVYQAQWRSPKDGGKWGAPHGIDIAFVFRNTAVESAVSTDSPEARRMADLYSDAFVAFARTGSPQTPALPVWEPYSLSRRQTMVMDLTPHLADDPRGEERKLFDKVPYVQPGT